MNIAIFNEKRIRVFNLESGITDLFWLDFIFKNITDLSIRDSNIKNIKFLEECHSIENLNLRFNKIKILYLPPHANRVIVQYNYIRSIKKVYGSTIESFQAQENLIKSAKPTCLREGVYRDILRDNKIKDQSYNIDMLYPIMIRNKYLGILFKN